MTSAIDICANIILNAEFNDIIARFSCVTCQKTNDEFRMSEAKLEATGSTMLVPAPLRFAS